MRVRRGSNPGSVPGAPASGGKGKSDLKREAQGNRVRKSVYTSNISFSLSEIISSIRLIYPSVDLCTSSREPSRSSSVITDFFLKGFDVIVGIAANVSNGHSLIFCHAASNFG